MVDYFPFDERPFRLRMAVRPLDLADWIEVDSDYPDQVAHKRELVATTPELVVGVVDHPAVRVAQDELWSLVEPVAPSPWHDAALDPIARCTGSTQEDWVLMMDLGRGPVLAAAGVCFPSRWVLAEKLGRTNREIHAPIAHYDEHLAAPVDQFFERLTVDRPGWRLNWNLFDDPALFQPVHADGPAAPRSDPAEGDDIADRVWLRVERQTLRRLPESGAIAFGIRIHQRPVRALTDRPDQLGTLATAIRMLPDDTFAYKGLRLVGAELLAWIDEQLRTG